MGDGVDGPSLSAPRSYLSAPLQAVARVNLHPSVESRVWRSVAKMIVSWDGESQSLSAPVENADSVRRRHARADSRYRYAEFRADFFEPRTSPRARRKKQLIIFAPREGVQRTLGAGKRSICRRKRQGTLPNYGADLAGFAEMAKVLQQPVTDIDHGFRKFLPGQSRASSKASGRIVMALHEVGNPRFLDSSLPSLQQIQTQGGISKSSGDV